MKFSRAVSKRIPLLLAVGTLLLGWQVLSWSYPAYLVPPLREILSRLFTDAFSAKFVDTATSSLYRLVVGYGISICLALVLGLLAAPISLARSYLRALAGIVQSVPPIAWTPFLVLILGFGERSVLTVVVIAGLSPIVLSILNATEGVSLNRLRLAQLFGANRLQLTLKVYVPEIIPDLLTGIQIGLGNAWRSLIAAEMVGGVNRGLGWSLTFSSEIADMAGVIMGIAVIGALATLIDRLILQSLSKRLLKWREDHGSN